MDYHDKLQNTPSCQTRGPGGHGTGITKFSHATLAGALLIGLFALSSVSFAADESDGVIFSSGFEDNPNAVSITSFSALQETVTAGENIELSWATENATSCVPSDGADGWASSVIDLPSGNQHIKASTAGTHEFTLTCSGPVDQESSAVSVTIEESPYACNVQLTSRIKRTWTEMFREAFPGPRSDEVRVAIPVKGYYTIAFNTGTAKDTGFFGNIEASGTFGYRLSAVSRCAGDFNVPPECSYAHGGDNGGIIWTTEGAPGRCQLEPNTTYYWNLTFTDGVDGDSSRCLGSYCETYFVVSNR